MKNIIISLLIASFLMICFVGCDFKEINEDKTNDSFNPNTNESEVASDTFSADLSSDEADEFNTDYYIDNPSFVSYSFSNLDEFYLYAETDEDDYSKFPSAGEPDFPGQHIIKYIDKHKFIRLADIFPEFLDGKLKLEEICVTYYDDYIYCFENDVLIFISPLRNWPENKATSYSYIEKGNKSNEVFFRLNDDIRITVRVNKSKENEIRKLSIDSLNELLSGEYTILAERIAEFSESKGNKN